MKRDISLIKQILLIVEARRSLASIPEIEGYSQDVIAWHIDDCADDKSGYLSRGYPIYLTQSGQAYLNDIRNIDPLESPLPWYLFSCSERYRGLNLYQLQFPQAMSQFAQTINNLVQNLTIECELAPIGNTNCKYNAMSSQLQCAVNPKGNCFNCSYFEEKE